VHSRHECSNTPNCLGRGAQGGRGRSVRRIECNRRHRHPDEERPLTSTRISRHIDAPREAVYRALLDPRAIAKWKVPDGMTCDVHEFDAREGGLIRVSLTYAEPTAAGKTTPHTDTYHGRFVRLVPDEQVVEVDEFETDDPALRGEMTITITLADAAGGTHLVAVHDGLPRGVSPADNEIGWQMALAKLAALVEAR
jgi:uncharacterized protein YndB with AHSA1/START domain